MLLYPAVYEKDRHTEAEDALTREWSMTLALIGHRSKVSPVGVDIGSSGVRAVQVASTDSAWRVTQMARVSIVDEKTDKPESPASPLRRCLQQARFGGKAAYAAISPSDVEFHALELPKALTEGGGGDVDQVVRHEITRLMTQPEEGVETRHWSLPPTTVPAPNAIGVAAGRKAIDTVMTTCEQAGLVCENIETAAGALCRFGTALQARGDEEVWGLLDLGERQARLVLCMGEAPILVRTIGDGGRSWTELIAESLQISFGAAEVHKCDNGVASTVRGTGPGAPEEPSSRLASMILGVLRSELNKLATEIKRSYEYVLGCYPGRRASDLVLVGGGALMHNVAGFMTRALGINVCGAGSFLGEETCRLKCTPSRRDPLELYAIATGLALGAEDVDVQV